MAWHWDVLEIKGEDIALDIEVEIMFKTVFHEAVKQTFDDPGEHEWVEVVNLKLKIGRDWVSANHLAHHQMHPMIEHIWDAIQQRVEARMEDYK